MSGRDENTGFKCEHCGAEVLPLTSVSYRNHCPHCLYSKHLDVEPGDRASWCEGLMEALGLRHRGDKGFQVVHRCLKCGTLRLNRVAENTVQPDDIEQLVRLPAM